MKLLILLASLVSVLAACQSELAIPFEEAPIPGRQEPAFDAWVAYGADGAVLDSGKHLIQSGLGAGPARDLALLGQERNPLASRKEVQLHPALEAKLAVAPDDEVLSIVLAVRSAHSLTALPRFDRELPRDDPANLQIIAAREKIQAADGELRAEERMPLIAAITALGGTVQEEFLVGNALSAELSSAAIRTLLATRPELAAASPSVSGEPPAAFSNIIIGRARQVSDPYITAGFDGAGYYIGLLDTGVYQYHNVLYNPDPILTWRDCANTTNSSCLNSGDPNYNPDDTFPGIGHGTAHANILVGNSNLGAASRGVTTAAILDSANVYLGAYHDTISTTAVLRAFNFFDGFDDVIMASVAVDESPSGTIALAADDLYDMGVLVAAPVGNIRLHRAYSPAIAHKVFALGGYYADTGNEYGPQSGGTDRHMDHRFKPDLLAPTEIIAAANTGPSDLGNFWGTCPAAAFAGGALTVLRDYFDYRGWSADPGAVYTAMITFGNKGGSNLNDYHGAGNLELGEIANSTWISGVRYLWPGDIYNVQFWVSGNNTCDLRTGIYWAENDSDEHATMYLDLYEGSTNRGSSHHFESIFQKLLWPYYLNPGWWRITLYSSSINPARTVKVHYLIHMRTNC